MASNTAKNRIIISAGVAYTKAAAPAVKSVANENMPPRQRLRSALRRIDQALKSQSESVKAYRATIHELKGTISELEQTTKCLDQTLDKIDVQPLAKKTHRLAQIADQWH